MKISFRTPQSVPQVSNSLMTNDKFSFSFGILFCGFAIVVNWIRVKSKYFQFSIQKKSIWLNRSLIDGRIGLYLSLLSDLKEKKDENEDAELNDRKEKIQKWFVFDRNALFFFLSLASIRCDIVNDEKRLHCK